MKEFIFEKAVLYLDNISQRQNFKFIKSLLGEHISVIFDVGCHKGETIDLILKFFKVEKIYAFEPNKILINKIDKSKYLNTEFINKALGEKKQSKKFFKSEFSPVNSLHKINPETNYSKFKQKIINFFFSKNHPKEENIDVITFDYFCKKYKIKSVDLLKIDTEGYEYYILQGAIKNLKKVKIILLEHHYDISIIKGYKFRQIIKILKNCGFEIRFKNKMVLRNIFEYVFVNKELVK
tara:strand:+ start:2693 stop:3403 length:711 start_codon:yes stop_codon:yes gene_type:complete